jgi:hypothetical protein
MGKAFPRGRVDVSACQTARKRAPLFTVFERRGA